MIDEINRLSATVVPFCLLSCFVASCGFGPEIDAVPSEALVADVRTPKEYRSKHFSGAINIPLTDIWQRSSELGDKNTQIVVYCKSGVRSEIAKHVLRIKGFKRVKNGGGIDEILRMPVK